MSSPPNAHRNFASWLDYITSVLDVVTFGLFGQFVLAARQITGQTRTGADQPWTEYDVRGVNDDVPIIHIQHPTAVHVNSPQYAAHALAQIYAELRDANGRWRNRNIGTVLFRSEGHGPPNDRYHYTAELREPDGVYISTRHYYYREELNQLLQ
ncbi:hypothetical protein CALCODRAFT_506075 [Calocera cornea HHB12733]|uniref:Uncharacterized protein n=1 Tax=Calocera cornea HHB12733 TaxID=1353952 RepID=A0A165JEX6_9BASI|nr:hypothetical protein CALCODRAFT_506075 [Calocera cornea HHB12733]